VPAGRFTSNLMSTRATLTLSPRALLGALRQYTSNTRSFLANLRFRWEYVPGSDLFVVYSEGRAPFESGGLVELQNRSVVVKVTRLFRY
jgi:hypothetical protein